MRSTFFGFEIARSGMQAAQAGLDTTGQNISNMSTEGYSRQTVSQSATSCNFTRYKISQNNKALPGMGVTIDGIRQIRDNFLDIRYCNANSEFNELSKSLSILTDIKNIFDETQTDGLNVMLKEFYADLQTLSENAGDVEFSSITRSSAQKLTETLNHYSKLLDTITEQETYDLTISADNINTILEKIDSLNKIIQVETLQKNAVNELKDTRSLYIDRLSAAINISVENNSDGTVDIKTGDYYLLNAQSGERVTLSVQHEPGNIQIITEDGLLEVSGGALRGCMDVLNGLGCYAGAGENDYRGIAYYKNSLDDFAFTLAETFNGLNGTDKPLFSGTTAGDITISDQWRSDANYITASISGGGNGANDNILQMIAAMDGNIEISPYFTGTFEEFTLSLMADIAIDTNYVSDMSVTGDLVLTSITNQRESIMGVSLNEETVNLLQYQKAFEAASRFMTVLDEALDIIINRMGIIGR